jgi:hypothetical protein
MTVMNMRLACLLLVATGLGVALPSARVHSQLAPPTGDPLADLQTIETANDDLIKRQEATLKDLSDTTDDANQLRIYARRG